MQIPTPAVALAFLCCGWAPFSRAQTDSDLFDDTLVRDLRLYVHSSDWRKLRANYLNNTYYPADLVWEGLMVQNVGIRSRGRGSRNAAKPGLRVDFDRFEDDQEFLGLKSLVLDNLTQDPPMARERLAMMFFRRLGIAAPREAYARLYVNDEYVGLYSLVEPIDKRFLRRNLDDDSGFLYEYSWAFPYDFSHLGDDPSLYVPLPFKPQTREKNPAPEVIAAMARAIHRSSDAEFETAASAYIDLKEWLAYVAVENFIAESDGFLGEVGMNNFYLYRPAGGTRFRIIPWDKDATFYWAAHPVTYQLESNVLTRRALAIPELRKYYFAVLTACADAADEGGWFASEARRLTDQAYRASLEDSNKPYSNEEFEEAVRVFRYFAAERSRVVRETAAEAIR